MIDGFCIIVAGKDSSSWWNLNCLGDFGCPSWSIGGACCDPPLLPLFEPNTRFLFLIAFTHYTIYNCNPLWRLMEWQGHHLEQNNTRLSNMTCSNTTLSCFPATLNLTPWYEQQQHLMLWIAARATWNVVKQEKAATRNEDCNSKV